MLARPSLIIAVVSKNRFKELSLCLTSLTFHMPDLNKIFNNWKVILLANTNDSNEISQHRQLLKILPPNMPIELMTSSITLHPGAARNLILSQYLADWFYFLDDDAYLPEEYIFTVIERYLNNADVIGGPNLTPPSQHKTYPIFSSALSSWSCTGPFSKRYKKSEPAWHSKNSSDFVLCNLLIRRKDPWLFQSDIPAGEENLLLNQLFKKSYRGHFISDFFVYHHRRHQLSDLILQFFKYGLGRSTIIMQSKGSMVICLITIPLVVFMLFVASTKFYSTFFIFYMGFVIFGSISQSNLSFIQKVLLWTLIPILHASYGLGCLVGLIVPTKNIYFVTRNKSAASD